MQMKVADRLEQAITETIERLVPERSENSEIEVEPLYPDRHVDGENQFFIATLLDGEIPENFLCDVDTANGSFVVYRPCAVEVYAQPGDN